MVLTGCFCTSKGETKLDSLIKVIKNAKDPELYQAEGEVIVYLYTLATEVWRKETDKILQLTESMGLNRLRASVLTHTYRFFDFERQLRNLREAEQISKKEERFIDLAAAYKFKGIIFRDNAQADSALLYVLAAKDLLEQYAPASDFHDVLHLIADMHYYAGEYSHATEIYKQILEELPKEEFAWWRHITINNNLGLLNLAQNKYPEAEFYFLLADSILQAERVTLGDSIGMIYTSRKLSELYIVTGHFRKAEEYCRRGLLLAAKLNETAELSGLYINQARIHMSQGSPQEAYPFLVQAAEIERGKNNLSLLRDLYEGFTEYYRVMGDYRLSNAYLHKLIAVNKTRDSSFSRTRILHIYAGHQYKNARQEELNIRYTNNLLYAVLVTISVAVLVFVYLYIRMKRLHKSLVQKNLEFINMGTTKPLGLVEGSNHPAAEPMTDEEEAEIETGPEQKQGRSMPEIEAALQERILTTLERLMHQDKIHLDKKTNARILIELLNTNKTYLYRIVESNYGLGVYDFINGYRIKHAITLIASGKVSHLGVDGLADECGFNNRVTFNKVFKKHTGVSPSVFISNVKIPKEGSGSL